MKTSAQAFAQARAAIPGGVNSPVRAWAAVGGAPLFISRARGAYITDIEGREYVDLVCTWGPSLLGHAHPQVTAAVREAAERGLSFGAPHENETVLANMITARMPPAFRIRMVSTGTEATMTAIRLARAVTGRPFIVKFAGCYHGHSDSLLVAAGSGVATQGLPGSAGVTAGTAADTLVVPYNDEAALERVFEESGAKIAAVITESAPANMGVITPKPGFNQCIRRLTREHGALMITDEVLTGFRCSPAGYWGLEAGYGPASLPAYLPAAAMQREEERRQWQKTQLAQAQYVPDIITFGKIVGGGMPLAALGGAPEIMDRLAPVGDVYQAGTLSGNPLAAAAGIATLKYADEAVYRAVDSAAEQLTEVLGAEFDRASVPFRINRAGSLFSVFFGREPAENGVENYAQARAQNTAAYTAFFHAMLDGGVYLPPSCFEAWFVSARHTPQVLDQIFAALPNAVNAVKKALG